MTVWDVFRFSPILYSVALVAKDYILSSSVQVKWVTGRQYVMVGMYTVWYAIQASYLLRLLLESCVANFVVLEHRVL